ncbi:MULTISPECIES: fumarylacetoacetate hydrolase family protein [unclassified Paenibacillus]|uniref:fumarylacetoacetate hydrolase family protein n=1 Tax=unclassified Paenibacillus TaxID=185978 RepID=UPI001AEB078D|nr:MULTISPECIES: fumarylacetoacetate hydrolase family protein [unclassified Paenibacillus]MBP1154976.1 2-keto-4-pentenoate hydratase/2-oxohepta-3-ene-1,7-dioic acid hydratase in catechol pathway [Paenibacillus sp. PvP091]MBP1169640.1 2-keto-4-pentenoate hydratase/2-oxohepta-3-ene-1,7-dioic acid hydratase in catechol pathway [Paenibacillus sp. PvR098]MBP2440668.1 2-keto-4-pentenoate hydratase/2-oxohepta-3-ene-1,7-dioic acid hydratase in catechol pathway [Paenibacillus sp. PvP052]
MKLVRFTLPDDTAIRKGIIENDFVREYTGDMFTSRIFTGNTFPLGDVRLNVPIMPRHIIGIGKNFVGNGVEKPAVPDMPILFFKPLTTVVGPGDQVLLPHGTEKIKFESELAVVIGKETKNITPEQADDVIFGYTVANDFGAIDYFHPEGHWTIGKSFDTFCPLGPVIETEFDYRSARIQAEVNGTVMQDGPMERIIMPIDRMIAYISSFMTLMPGDVILTGTPDGADMVGDGDVVDCKIEGIGILRNQVSTNQ